MCEGKAVSVVIPTYNGARFILEALQSVFSQTYQIAEIIVVDDGSTDNTKEVLEPFCDRLTYIKQTNAGPSAARNRGVRFASGDWVAFLDSDDCWEVEHISRLVEKAHEYPGAAMVYCGKRWVDAGGRFMDNIPLQKTFPSGWIFNELFHANYISSASVVIVKRQCFMDAGGFNERFTSIAEDYDLWMRISAVSPIVGVPVYTVRYRRHDTNLTLQTVKQIEADLEILKSSIRMIAQNEVNNKNRPERIAVRRRMKLFYTDAASCLFNVGAYDQMRSLGYDALICGYVTPGVLIRWVLCFLPLRITAALRQLRRNLI